MARKGKLGQKQIKGEIQRPIRWKKYEYLFLIVCEDQKTEPQYFMRFVKLFPDETIYVRPIGAGLDPKGVAERAIVEKDRLEAESRKEIDFVWIVFDVDDAGMNEARFRRFNEAFEIARKTNFNIAWSNEVFELWLLLYLTDVKSSPALRRQEVYQAIQDQVRQRYSYERFIYEHGDDQILEIIFQVGNENEAIARAENLLRAHEQRSPINANPCTTVHVLVSELRQWIGYYNYDPGG